MTFELIGERFGGSDLHRRWILSAFSITKEFNYPDCHSAFVSTNQNNGMGRRLTFTRLVVRRQTVDSAIHDRITSGIAKRESIWMQR